MNTAQNVKYLDWAGSSNATATITTITDCANTDTASIYYSPYYYAHWWYPLTPIIQKDEAKELKAWLDGFLKNRKLTEKNIEIIRDKLEQFIQS